MVLSWVMMSACSGREPRTVTVLQHRLTTSWVWHAMRPWRLSWSTSHCNNLLTITDKKLPMPPVLGGMGRINDIDSNDTSRYHPPPTTSIIKSLSVNQLSPSVPQSLSSSVPQFLSFVLGGILDTYKLQVIIFYYIYNIYYIYNKLLNKDKSEGSEKN